MQTPDDRPPGERFVRIDLRDANLAQYDAVCRLLEQRQAYFEVDGDDLVVPAELADELRTTLREAAHQDLGRAVAVARRRPDRNSVRTLGDRHVVLAPLWQRPVRWIVDGLAYLAVLLIAFGVTGGFVDRSTAATGLAPLVAWIAAVVAPVSITGLTLGGLVTATRVVDRRDGGPPGWGLGLARSLGPAVPSLVGQVVTGAVADARLAVAASIASFVAWVVMYASLLGHPDRQGLHERWSSTVVIRRAGP